MGQSPVPSIIRHNLGLKFFSLALAILGWAYFRFANNPVITARFDQQLSVPIAPVNLPQGYVARFADKVALVTIASKRDEPPVRPEEVKAVVDLSNRTAGVYNLPIRLVAPKVAVQSLSPASVTLTVARIDQKSFALALHYAGSSRIVVSKATVTPNAATARGPTDELAQVASVRVDVALTPAHQSVDEMIRPVAVNAAGQPVGDVLVTPNLVRVQAHFLPATASAITP